MDSRNPDQPNLPFILNVNVYSTNKPRFIKGIQRIELALLVH